MKWYLKVLREYARFSGRASIREYWTFTLWNLIFALVFMIVDNILGIAFEPISDVKPLSLGFEGGPFYFIYSILVMIPALAVSVRRLHDIGKSGWKILMGLIPVFGPVYLLILFTRQSGPDYNPAINEPGDASRSEQSI